MLLRLSGHARGQIIQRVVHRYPHDADCQGQGDEVNPTKDGDGAGKGDHGAGYRGNEHQYYREQGAKDRADQSKDQNYRDRA